MSQKELEKALRENIDPAKLPELHKMKARIEVVCDYDDLKSVNQMLKSLARKENP